MSEAVTQEVPAKTSTGFVKVILTSSLATAVIALLGTLTGLMFRAGWLGVYGVSAELFIPESATELAYWGFLAVLFAWSNTSQWVAASVGLILGTALLYSVVIAVGLSAWLWTEKNGTAVKTRLAFLKDKKKAVAVLSGIAFVVISAAPLILLALSAAVISTPLLGHSAGEAAAEKNRRHYEVQLKNNMYSCARLTGAAGVIGQCPMVIAQSKERIAYMDGDRVHIIPSQGVSVSEQLTPLPPPRK